MVEATLALAVLTSVSTAMAAAAVAIIVTTTASAVVKKSACQICVNYIPHCWKSWLHYIMSLGLVILSTTMTAALMVATLTSIVAPVVVASTEATTRMPTIDGKIVEQ